MITKELTYFSNIHTKLVFGFKWWYDNTEEEDYRYFTCEELPVAILIDDERKPKGDNWHDWLDKVLKGELIKEDYINKFRQEEFTYLVQDGPIYKIGKSKDVKNRFYNIVSTNPSCTLVGHIENVPEMVLHHMFRFWRVKGEWFRVVDHERNSLLWWFKSENKEQKTALLKLYIYCNQGIKYETGRALRATFT